MTRMFLAAMAALMFFPVAESFAQASADRLELFKETIVIGAKIDAMDEACRRLSAKDTSMDRPVVEQVIEGFELENETPAQKELLEKAAKEAFDEKMRELDADEELACDGSSFLWEKHGLTKLLSAQLKKIIKAREEEASPKAL